MWPSILSTTADSALRLVLDIYASEFFGDRSTDEFPTSLQFLDFCLFPSGIELQYCARTH